MQYILIFVSQWKEAWISHSHSGVAAVECIKEGMFYPKLNNPNLQVWMDTKRETFAEFKRTNGKETLAPAAVLHFLQLPLERSPLSPPSTSSHSNVESI